MTFHSFDMRGIGARRLRFAILASLVFHLLLLWPDLPRAPNQDTVRLQATLRRLSPNFPASVAPAPSPLPRAPTLPPAVFPGTQIEPAATAADTATASAARITQAQPPPVLATKEFGMPRPTPVPAVPAQSAVPVSPPASRAALPAPAAASLVSAPVAPAGASSSGALLTQANASGEALEGLRGYRLAVATQARRFKRYPRQAMAEGWAGSTEVRLEVGSDGRPRAATVFRPSGHVELDRAALTMIDFGAQRAQLPESLRGKPFAVLLPVVFNLEDE